MPTTPRGFPLITADQQYTLVDDYNKLAAKADAEATVTEARAREVADAAKVFAQQAADGAERIASDALATVAPVRALVDSANAKADQAVSTADAAYRYNQSLVGALPEQIDAVLADGQSDAGQRLLQRVHVNDTNVGVTQQPGATDLERLHAACAEASERGANVQLPPWPLDVEAGFDMTGYTCGLVGYGSSYRWVTGYATPQRTGSGLFASRQDGPVLNLDGYKWPGFFGRAMFEGFALIGSKVAAPSGGGDAIMRQVGLRALPPSGVGATNATFRNISVADTIGPGLHTRVMYFTNWTGIALSFPIDCAANDVPAAWFQNFSSNDINLLVTGPDTGGSTGAWMVPKSGLVRITGYVDPAQPAVSFDSRDNDIYVRFERFQQQSGSSLIYHEGNLSTIRYYPWDGNVCTQSDPDSTSAYVRLASAVGGSTVNGGGNLVTGYIAGNNGTSTRTTGAGVAVEQWGNSVVGTRGWGEGNVQIGPGITGSYVELRPGWGGTKDTSGIRDLSGRPGENTLLDYSRYPHDGRTRPPVTVAVDRSIPTTGATDDAQILIKLEGNATYRVTAEVLYTAAPAVDLRLGWIKKSTLTDATIMTTTVDGLPRVTTGGATNTVERQQFNGNGPVYVGGTGDVSSVRVSALVKTVGKGTLALYAAQVDYDGAKPVVIHAGSVVRAEKVT